METYYHRFNEVLTYIHFHLEEKLDLEKLAAIAFVSKYHFHRMIKSYLGESLGAYVNRIRVETGAQLLKYSDNTITEIAYKIGYETPTSFNKSFKKQFNVSPSQFRKNPNHSFERVKNKKQKTNFDLVEEKENIQPVLLLCNQSKGIIGSKETNKVWNDLMSFAMQKNLLTQRTKLYGIHWDDPSITLKQHLRYDACISIEQEITPSPYTIKGIAGGRYRSFTYKGDFQYLGDVYDQIFRDHILTKNIVLREEPLFDQYLNNDGNQTAPEDLLTKIYIPVA